MSSNPRVLLVDDDPDISLALSDYLGEEGFDVEVVETGNSALRKSTTQPYDVVLLDVGLPDRDGIEVLVELSDRKPLLPIVLLTAFSTLRKTTSPHKLNRAFAYLTKPYSREEVKEVLQRSIIRHKEMSNETTRKLVYPDSDSKSYTPFHFPAILQPIICMDEEVPLQDISAKSGGYQLLVENLRLRQLAFDTIPEAILVADATKHIRFANQAAAQILGYSENDLENLRIQDIAPNHDKQRYHEHLQELREGKTLSYYTTHLTKDGKHIPITISVYLFNIQGKEYTLAITKSSPRRS